MIWFKNAQVYQLAESANVSLEEWQEKMAEHLYAPCLQQQAVSLGWVPAIPGTDALVHVNGDHWLLCLQRQERLLPGPVIREVLQEKVEQIQHSEERRVGSKERQTLKDEVIFSLLPKAFVRTSRHYLYINVTSRYLVVDSASETRADDVTSFLRESLGSLPLTILQSHCLPAPVLTSWVADAQNIAAGWELQPDLELTQSSNSDIKVRLKNVELDSDAVATHLEQDGQVMQIAFDWQERIQAVITSKAQLKRIRYADLITEQAMNDGADDKVSQFDASFHLMASDLTKLIAEMRQLFGLAQE